MWVPLAFNAPFEQSELTWIAPPTVDRPVAADVAGRTSVRFEGDERRRHREVFDVRGRARPKSLVLRDADDAAEERRPLRPDPDFDVTRVIVEDRLGPGRDLDLYQDRVHAILEPVLLRQRASRSDRAGAGPVGERSLAARIGQIAGASQRRRVGGILRVSPLEEILTDVEDQRRDGQDGDQRKGEDDERLPATRRSDQWLTTRVVLPVSVKVGSGT